MGSGLLCKLLSFGSDLVLEEPAPPLMSSLPVKIYLTSSVLCALVFETGLFQQWHHICGMFCPLRSACYLHNFFFFCTRPNSLFKQTFNLGADLFNIILWPLSNLRIFKINFQWYGLITFIIFNIFIMLKATWGRFPGEVAQKFAADGIDISSCTRLLYRLLK